MVDVVRDIYGLTAAETRVISAPLQEDGLQAVADQLCVSITTVKTHLQHVFEKAGTHRQAGWSS